MSVHVASEVYKAKLGSPTRKAIALKLADHANDDGGSIRPSVERVARETENSARTVQRTLKDFVSEGLLIVEKLGGMGPKSTTHYRFNLKALAALPRTNPGDPHKDDTVSPLPQTSRVTPTAAKGDIGGMKGDTVSPEPSYQPSRPVKDHRSLKSDLKSTPARPARFVSEAALEGVRSVAPGWDRQELLRRFLAWDGSKTATDMDRAFLGWVRKITKGKPPPGANLFVPKAMPKERDWELT